MDDLLKALITDIDLGLSMFFTGKYYGLAELVNGQAERYPVTIHNAKRDRINPADTWQLQTYHRILNSTEVSNTENFGREKTYDQIMRMIVITNVNLGESFAWKLLDVMPEQVSSAAGYGVVMDASIINNDHEGIVTTEFGNIPEDKHRLQKNIIAIDYTLKVTLCK